MAPGEGVLPKLKGLNLSASYTGEHNPITDAGCAMLADALDGGVLPKLSHVDLYGVPASDEAQEAVEEALARAIARRA